MPVNIDSRQIKNVAALPSIGSAANESLDSVMSKLDASVLATINEVNTGHYAWTGSGAYYSITGGSTFNLLRGGSGYILNKLVNYNGAQSIALTANKTCYIYVDSTGTIGKVTNDTVNPSTYENNIVLFEALYDGTNVIVTKDNHPYSFPSKLATFLHQNAGIVIRSTGAIITRVATGTGAANGDRQLKIVGADVVDDHGVSTIISDTAGAAQSINWMYKNASGQWVRYAAQDQAPMFYESAGTPTAITSGSRAIYVIYVSKDDINSSSPVYFGVMNNAQYATSGAATTALTNGTFVVKSNELDALELAQLGYIIVRNSGGGYIETVTVSKSSFGSKIIGGGASATSHLLLNDLSGGVYQDGGHTNLATVKSTTTDPTVNDDSTAYKVGAIWINTSKKAIWELIDSTAGAAVWVPSGIRRDTAANLATYASTAVNGEIVFATDTKVYQIVVDGALQTLLTAAGTRQQVANVNYFGAGTRTTLSGTPVAMPLTSTDGDTSIVSIASNRFTLQTGEYNIVWSFLWKNTTETASIGHYLYNYTDSIEIKRGSISWTNASNIDVNVLGSTRLTLAGAKAFELRVVKVGTPAGNSFIGDTFASPNDLNGYITIVKLS